MLTSGNSKHRFTDLSLTHYNDFDFIETHFGRFICLSCDSIVKIRTLIKRVYSKCQVSFKKIPNTHFEL